jgi:hypothetical protein
MNLRKACFQIETFPGKTFEGYTNGEEWNGWSSPYFDFNEAMKIVEAHEKALNIQIRYEEVEDKFTFEFPGKTEEYQAVVIEDKKLYPIGNSVWIWEEV